jgi:hypothetical protein
MDVAWLPQKRREEDLGVDPENEQSAGSTPPTSGSAKVRVVSSKQARGVTNDPNRLSWPPTRTDVFAVLAFALAVYCVAIDRWPWFAALAFAGAFLAAFSSRMRDWFGLVASRDGIRIGGGLADPFGQERSTTLQAPADEPELLPPAPTPEELPRGSSTPPIEG